MRIKKTVGHHPGRLVAFEGIDRAGKSSILRVLPEMLRDCQVPVVTCGELQSPLATIIRQSINSGGSAFLKTFLFASDRAWTYERVCLPALLRGEVVLWDRYVDSAIVYRTVEFSRSASEIGLDFVETINSPFPLPELTIYVDISAETSQARAELSGAKEPYSLDFLQNVRFEYLRQAVAKGYVVVNGEEPLNEVATKVAQIIRQYLDDIFLQ